MSGDCPECGGRRLWGGRSWLEHDDGFHHFKRRILLRTIGRRLKEEAVYRAMARDMAAAHDSVLVMWRIVMPTQIYYATTETAGDVWDQPVLRDELLASLHRKMQDDAQQQFGTRPGPMQVKYRVFDER